jgi:hypothetical protein
MVTILGTGEDAIDELSFFEQLEKAKRLTIKKRQMPLFFILIPFCKK